MKLTIRNKRTARVFHVLLLMAVLVLCFTGCKTSRQAQPPVSKETGYLSSKVQLTIPHKDAVLTVNGTLRLKKGERVQLSFQMPVLRAEVARVELTPDTVLMVDRMGKRFVRASRDELKDVLPRKADFSHLEKLLYEASRPGGKAALTGKDLGIPSMTKGQIALSDFSDKEFTMVPTRLSSKYEEVALYELLEMLMSL